MRINISKNLYLETVEKRHALRLFKLIDANRGYLKEWMPWVDSTLNVDDLGKFIADSQDKLKQHNGFNAVIFYNHKIAGSIGMHNVNWTDKNVAIGYWLSQVLQGKGIITDSCRALVNHCFSEMKLHRVEIHCAVNNYKSRAVPVRLGFAQEGILKESVWLNGKFVDMAVYALLNPV